MCPSKFVVTTEQAKNMRNRIDIEGTIERMEEPRTVNLKTGGTTEVCNAYLVDEVGEIKITLWGEDIAKVKNGSKVAFKNAYTSTFKNEVSLAKGKYGELIVKD
ncbi:Single-stranded DNA-binding replication protein A, large (70 kD) subunit [Candidatus Nitrosotenuis uzonensis]|uniref:Single-stranded DNA-binding replication protein A, large (70 kD) subunit n=1 Tax=Candidatus Nitrosotenuis uzonensis TaxID=1407055 RepID=A0A812F214_9ARCH|nr:Single-stranded DNA-binding replication protein A, large (70 kD) subunit [Candidatus Nitrosotenuis uzonensis]